MSLVETQREWIKPFVDNRKKILEEYLKSHQKFQTINPPGQEKWNLDVVKDDVVDKLNMALTPFLESLIQKIPKNHQLLDVTFSRVVAGLNTETENHGWHFEPFPVDKGFKRFHVPLQIQGNVRLETKSGDFYTWEEGKQYLFDSITSPHRIVYEGEGLDRIVLLIDVFEDTKVDESVMRQAAMVGEVLLKMATRGKE
jgi:hypothetical protein